MKKLLTAVALTAAATTALAEPNFTAGRVYDMCTEPKSDPDHYACLMYLLGAADGVAFGAAAAAARLAGPDEDPYDYVDSVEATCFPDGTTANDMRAAVLAFIDVFPKTRDRAASYAVPAIFRSNWPCP